MTKQEFLETLGKILNRELPEQEVADNLRYYEQYIAQQMRNGRTEEEVLSELGDPRLIAKTILQVDGQREEMNSYDSVYSENADGTFEEEETEPGNGGFGDRIHVHTVSDTKARLTLILVLIAVILVLCTVFRILWRLLPVLVVIAAVLWLYQKFVQK